MLSGMGAGKRAGRRRLPPRPGQLDFSQPSDSVSLSNQVARQADKRGGCSLELPWAYAGAISSPDHRDWVYISDAPWDWGIPKGRVRSESPLCAYISAFTVSDR